MIIKILIDWSCTYVLHCKLGSTYAIKKPHLVTQGFEQKFLSPYSNNLLNHFCLFSMNENVHFVNYFVYKFKTSEQRCHLKLQCCHVYSLICTQKK